MANVITRRVLTRTILGCKNVFKVSNIKLCSSFVLTKIDFEQNKPYIYFQNHSTILINRHKFINLRYYSVDSKKDEEKNSEIKENGKGPKQSLIQRFKQMYRDYWYVLVPVHLVTSAVWFGGFYYLSISGIDIVYILESLHVSEKIINSMKDSSMGHVAVAYALYKIATPVRYTVTIGGTTVSIQYLTKLGYIKPVPSKERLVEMYQEAKVDMKERKENLMENVKDIKERKDNLMESVRETKDSIKEKKDNLFESVRETKASLKDPGKVLEDIKKKFSESSTKKKK